MEVLIKYCMNSFPQVDQFIRIQISFYFLCVSCWSIGSETKSNWLITLACRPSVLNPSFSVFFRSREIEFALAHRRLSQNAFDTSVP